jgi:septum formation protein
MTRIILASSSPRRRELLTRAGVRFTVVEPPPDGATPPGVCGELVTQLLARQKAAHVLEGQTAGTFVIGADTIVVGPDGQLGKPGTPERAREMLRELRGRRHTVLTGICVMAAGGDEALGVSRSAVKMRAFSDDDLEAYVLSGEPLDKAGGYAVQGGAADFVEAIGGRVDTVVGLDCVLTLKLLAEAGYPDPLPAATDIPLQQGRSARRPLSPMRTVQRV